MPQIEKEILCKDFRLINISNILVGFDFRAGQFAVMVVLIIREGEMVNLNELTSGQRRLAFFLAIKKQDGLIVAIVWAWRNRKNHY